MVQVKCNNKYMRIALQQAQKAFEKDEVPIGAVVVGPDGLILSKAYNQVERKKSQLAHAEIMAIEKATKKVGDWRLDDCSIYVTIEPCAMCMNLILLSRFKELVYGATSPLFGYHLDKEGPHQVYRRNTIKIVKGVCGLEAAELMKQFFKKKRKKSEWSKEKRNQTCCRKKAIT